MNECQGILGRKLGHKFVSLLIQSDFHHNIQNATGMCASDMRDLVREMSYKKYKIVCQRCGKEPKNEQDV